MKRLLLVPLLITGFVSPAIAVPWNQINTTTDIGGKITVRDATVIIKSIFVENLESDINYYFNNKAKSKVAKIDNKISKLDNKIRVQREHIRAKEIWCKSKYYICSMEMAKFPENYPIFVRGIEAPDLIRYFEGQKRDLMIARRRELQPINKDHEDIQIGLEKVLETIHYKKVSFREIYTNLNNYKTVKPRRSINCFNPKLDKKTKQLWNKYSHQSPPPKGSFYEKLCKRHAKF